MRKLFVIISTMLSLSSWQAKAGTGYQLDSTITKDASGNLIEKTVYGRDSINNIIMQATYSWDSKLNIWIGVKKTEFILNHLNASYNGWDTTSGSWIGDSRYADSYDKNGKVILREIDKGWNKITGTWIGYSKEEHHYDNNGLDTLGIYYTWNTATSGWVGKTKTISHKYSNSVCDSLIKIDYKWNVNSQTWINNGKTKSYFDANGKDTLDISTDASGVNTTKTESKYDSDGNLTIQTSYTWYKTKSLWISPKIKLGTKNEKTVDSKGNIILYVEYIWDNITSAWVNSSKTEHAYDSNNKITLEASYTWDSSTSAWVGNQKSEYAFDENGFKIQYISYTWDSNTATWVNSMKKEYTYKNPSSNPYQTLEYSWNTTTQKWIITSGTQSGNTYDSYGNALSYNSFSLDIASNKWIPTGGSFHTNIENITYNNSGKITQKIYVSYIGNDSTKYKEDYTYDNKGKYTTNTYVWNFPKATWVKKGKTEWTYDNNGKLTEYADYAWDTVSNVWIGQYNKYEYVFDKNGIKTQYIKSSWDSTNVAWKIDGITTYYKTAIAATLSVSKNSVTISAAQNSKASVIVNSDFPWSANFNGSTWLSTTGSNIGGEGKDIELIFKAMANPTTSPRTATVIIEGKSEVYSVYSNALSKGISTTPIIITVTQEAGDGTPVLEVNKENISLYPNPTKTFFTVNTDENAQVEVFTVNGQLVLTKQTTAKENIPIGNLSTGLYIVKIKTANAVETRSLIVE